MLFQFCDDDLDLIDKELGLLNISLDLACSFWLWCTSLEPFCLLQSSIWKYQETTLELGFCLLIQFLDLFLLSFCLLEYCQHSNYRFLSFSSSCFIILQTFVVFHFHQCIHKDQNNHSCMLLYKALYQVFQRLFWCCQQMSLSLLMDLCHQI